MPHRNPKTLIELEKSLVKVDNGLNYKNIIVAGDFNCSDINWGSNTLYPSASNKAAQQALINLKNNQ